MSAKKVKFTKEELLQSKRFADEKDLLSAVLDDGVKYTHEDAELLIQQYLERKVN